MSAETTSTFLFSRSRRNFASLATEVVLPAPCRPAISTTAGEPLSVSASLACPMIASSSCWTILTNCCPGERLLETSWPTARSRTRSTKSLTTGKATSASSKARRTSRRVSLMLSSVRRAWPVIDLSVCDRRLERLSNMKRSGQRCLAPPMLELKLAAPLEGMWPALYAWIGLGSMRPDSHSSAACGYGWASWQ